MEAPIASNLLQNSAPTWLTFAFGHWVITIFLAFALFWAFRDLYFFLRYRGCEFQIRDGYRVETNPEMLVVLIHGTWGRRTEFLNEKDHLCDVLKTKLEDRKPEFRWLTWSGANLRIARSSACEYLVTKLNDAVCENKSIRSVLLIAHSHGGNIAYDAAAKMIRLGVCTRKSLDLTEQQPEHEKPTIAVVALATPFLLEQENKLSFLHLLTPCAFVAIVIAIAYWPPWLKSFFLTLLSGYLAVNVYVHSLIWLLIIASLFFISRWLLSLSTIRGFVPPVERNEAPPVLAIVNPNDEAMAAISLFKLLEGMLRGAMRYLRTTFLPKTDLLATMLAPLPLIAFVCIAYRLGNLPAESSALSWIFWNDTVRRILEIYALIGVLVVSVLVAVIAARILFRLLGALLLILVIPDAFIYARTKEFHVMPAPLGSCEMIANYPSGDPVIFHSDFANTTYFDMLLKWIKRRC